MASGEGDTGNSVQVGTVGMGRSDGGILRLMGDPYGKNPGKIP